MNTFQPHPLQDACDRSDRLLRLLDEEFDALRQQDLDRFDALQTPKLQLLQDLSAVVDARRADIERQPDATENTLWDALIGTMDSCRTLHRRNEILIDRKREAIQGALLALTGGASSGLPETYDKLGRVVRHSRARGYEDA
jgi:flagellar biosynthesis/type III secretory pathway chaperone